MFRSIRESILAVLKQFSKVGEIEVNINSILIELPRDDKLGDLYTNAAMMFSKRLSVAPSVLATALCDALKRNELVSDATVAGPGFVNFRLHASAWQGVVNEVLEKREKYGYVDIHSGAPINVEFVSANPTGPLHTGHARNAVFGSVIANLLDRIGYTVTKEFYINDQGNQIKSLARSIYLRYREIMGATLSDNEFTDDMYRGDYIKDLAQGVVDIYEDKLLNKSESEWLDILCKYAVDRMMKNVKEDLALLGVVMDEYTSEADLCRKQYVDEALAILTDCDDIYEGILPRPKGITDSDDWEERPQTLFKSTKYGDDVDRAIRKSDGTWTYFAGDLAYHLYKIKRGFKKMVAVLGADHSGYVKRLKAAVKALSYGKSEIEIVLYQLVNFLENGVPVRMSKRSGSFITLRDVVDKVGCDITRYMMISRHHDVMIDFDFAKVIERSMENPVFYVQYAYARICSVFRNYEIHAEKIDDVALLKCDKTSLKNKAEIDLMKAIALWPEYIKSAATAMEPHRIPNYLQNIASLFHTLWNMGKINSELRFIDYDNPNDTMARLSLLQATQIVLNDGFKIIGITPLSEMK